MKEPSSLPPLDQPLPITGTWEGREYPGEVLRASSWRSELTQLPAESYFRIVLLTGADEIPPQAVSDPRLAWLLPAPPKGIIREDRERYGVRPAQQKKRGATAFQLISPLPIPTAPLLSLRGWEQCLKGLASTLLAAWGLHKWNLCLPRSQLLLPSLRETGTAEDLVAQGRQLLSRIQELGRLLLQLRSGLEQLYADAAGAERESALSALQRLSTLCVPSVLEFLHSLECNYPTVERLHQDLALAQRVQTLLPQVPAILTARSYLSQATPAQGELALDRLSLLERLSTASLIENPRLWESLNPLVAYFRERYQPYYAHCHRRYHQEVKNLKAMMAAAERKIEALDRLNAIRELGPSIGEGLAGEHRELLGRLQPCSYPEDQIGAEAPLCPRCHLLFPAQPPTEAVATLLHRLDSSLIEQQRRLSTRLVQRILSGQVPTWSGLDQFLNALRASDLQPLVNVLDDNMVDFIRRLLAEAETVVVKTGVLRDIERKYPRLREQDSDALLTFLAQGLKEAFQRAKQEHPGKNILLSLEQ